MYIVCVFFHPVLTSSARFNETHSLQQMLQQDPITTAISTRAVKYNSDINKTQQRLLQIYQDPPNTSATSSRPTKSYCNFINDTSMNIETSSSPNSEYYNFIKSHQILQQDTAVKSATSRKNHL